MGSVGNQKTGAGEHKADHKAKMVAAMILGVAKSAYGSMIKTIEDTTGAPLKTFRRREGYYTCPGDFYTHGSKTFLKNKRKGL